MNKTISTFFNVWGRSNGLKLGQKVLLLPDNVLSMSLELVSDKYRTFWPNSMNTFYNPILKENSKISLNNQTFFLLGTLYRTLMGAIYQTYYLEGKFKLVKFRIWKQNFLVWLIKFGLCLQLDLNKLTDEGNFEIRCLRN